MVKNYFIQIDGKQTGPFSANQILAQAIHGEFQVWTEGMSEWKTYPSLSVFKLEMTLSAAGDEKPDANYKTITSSNEILYEDNNRDKNLASLGRRFTASIIYGILFWTVVFAITGTEANTGYIFLVMFLILCLNLVSYRYSSGNIGHTILGLKVIYADSKEDFNNPLLGLGRELVKGFLSTFIIPLAFLFFSDKKQNLYDLVFNTIVVKKDSDRADAVKKDTQIVKKMDH